MNGKINKIKEFLLTEKDELIKESFKKDLKKKEQEVQDLETQINKIKSDKEGARKGILSYENLLKLFDELPSRIRKIKKMQSLDAVIRNIFLNFIIENRKVASHKLKSPFDELIEKQKSIKVTDGGPGWT